MKVILKKYTNGPLMAIEEAACKCYDSEPDNGRIARGCIRSGHTSVTEFAEFTFEVEGVSRALLAQLTRHRVGTSFAVQSQRYCSMNGFDYVTPSSVAKNDEAKEIYDNTMQILAENYAKLQELGVVNEDARMILPNACCTKLMLKMNLRALIHFCNERLCTRAQWEIRQFAQELVKCVLEVAPELKSFLVPKCEMNQKYPFCTEFNSCGRHPKLKDVYKE